MLRKYYDCNNSVTNVESGSRSAIVRNGHQILHCQNGGDGHAHARYCALPGAIIRVGKLEKLGASWKLKVGSWKLDKTS